MAKLLWKLMVQLEKAGRKPASGASTAGQPIGLLLVLTKAS